MAAVAALLVAVLALGDTAQAIVAVSAVLVFLFALVRALDSESYRKRDADIPVPPGGHAPGGY